MKVPYLDRFWQAVLCLLLSVPTPGGAAPPVQPEAALDAPVVMTIDGSEQITIDQLRRYASRRIDLKALMASTEGWKTIAREYALTRALIREGMQAGINRPPLKAEDEADPMFADDLYALKVFEARTQNCRFENTESALKPYYEANPKAFQLPASVRVERIMLPDRTVIGPLSAHAWLMLQARAVTDGHAQFEKLIERAKEYAPDIYQGDLGWQVIDDRIDLLAALGQANEGNLVGPLREGDYWVLLRVTAKRPAILPPWDAVQHQALAVATQHCKESEHERVINELFQKYRVHIDDEALKRAISPQARP